MRLEMMPVTSALWVTKDAHVDKVAETRSLVRRNMVFEPTFADAATDICEEAFGRLWASFADAVLDRLVTTCVGRASLSMGTAEDHQ